MRKIYVKMGLVLTMMLGTVFLTVFLSYAWFVRYVPTKPIIIYTGSLTTKATLYRADDPDFDGIFDDDDYIMLTEAYSFNNATPGQTHSFKMEIKNTGTVNGHLSLIMKDIISEGLVCDSFTIHYFDPNNGEEIELLFSDARDGDINNITLFKEYELEANSTFSFKFQFKISGDVDQLQGKSMKISNYVVQLDQIRS